MTEIFIVAAHWSEVDPAEWPARFFSPREIASKDDGSIKVSRRALIGLDFVREDYGAPLRLRSAYRTPAHNTAVGGAVNSFHPKGLAFDVELPAPGDGPILEDIGRRRGARGFGRYPSRRFIHLDWRTGREAAWGAWA